MQPKLMYLCKNTEKPLEPTGLALHLTLSLAGWVTWGKPVSTSKPGCQAVVRVGDDPCQTPGKRAGLQQQQLLALLLINNNEK
jgi:hypothetical protein